MQTKHLQPLAALPRFGVDTLLSMLLGVSGLGAALLLAAFLATG